ncbi:MAG: heme ABC transporter permease, partial [Sphingomonadales bacterium]|nr:heme ABC transporter permease [Sphingomonadales bacterium]
MHGFANPARFLRFARPATTWSLTVGLVLLAVGLLGGLLVTPPDYLQGDSVRILYIHVPAAWLGMAGWGGIAAA